MDNDLLKGADTELIRAWRIELARKYPIILSQLSPDEQKKV